YRGKGTGLVPILVVAPLAEQPSIESLRRLEHQYALRGQLDRDWSARPLGLSRHCKRAALVVRDPGGEPLDLLLGRPLGTANFLRVAIPLAAAVGRMHARNLIHRDVNPANILVDIGTGAAWLTGFGIASRLPREHEAPQAPEGNADRLAYIAPEQTG